MGSVGRRRGVRVLYSETIAPLPRVNNFLVLRLEFRGKFEALVLPGLVTCRLQKGYR